MEQTIQYPKALSKEEAITTIKNLSDRFITQFHRVVKLSTRDICFKMYCTTMQECWDIARRIKLKDTDTTLSIDDLVDWFLTQNSNVEDIINEDYTMFYKLFCSRLIKNPDMRIYDILSEL